jgi:two-component system sensor histidine kinase KdpD
VNDDEDDSRPDPDALLARAKVEARAASLKIFFGAAPGVGKTFAMLETAQRLRAEGVDVVVGVVETHGRADTKELLEGLEVLPRRTIDHRGVQITELDLEAALARRPALILIDELAHTNAPGSRHVKRWQDVMELLEAGIDVHSTLNVQHVESIGDVVQQITGVKVRETVPDAVLERADEIELIDLPPEELLERLAEGKVYLGAAAGRAADNFFQRGNLLALRELALRRVAERVDAEVQAYRREHGIVTPWASREHVLVCAGASPSSERLIRAGARMAERLGARWVVATVDAIGAAPLGDRDRDRLEQHLRLAESLGADVVRLRGLRVADTVLQYAREHNVTRILAGKPTHSRWRDRLRGSLLDRLIRGSGEIDIHVIAPVERGPVPAAAYSRRLWIHAEPAAYGWAVLGVVAVTLLGLALFEYLTLADLAMAYLIAIMLAALAGRGPSLLAASLSVAAFDFCFVPPRFTFAVSDLRYILTFAVMFGAGLAVSELTIRLRRQELEATDRARRTAALLAFSRDVAAADEVEDIAAITIQHVEGMLGVAASVLVPDPGGGLIAAAGLMPLAAQEATVARWAHDHRQPAGHGTSTLPGAHIIAMPMMSGDRSVGVLVVQSHRETRPLEVEQRHLADTIARQAALAIGRSLLATEAGEAMLRARTEELRSALLSAVSHDLRTPLAVITGAATSLRDDEGTATPEVRRQMLDSVIDEARRLERVLTNLLNITRVESGIEPSREWVPADELVGAALARLDDVLGDRPVVVDLPAELLLWVDPILFEQVLLNLVENAAKHGAPPIEIRGRRTGGVVTLEIADHGPGVPADAAVRIFEKFFRAPGTRARGVGLGLAICRGIVEAHGGTIAAESAPGGGARFRIALPTPAAPAADAPMAEARS